MATGTEDGSGGVAPSELVARAQAGDSGAWEELVARYTNLLWSVARSFRLDTADAADVVQTTWLRLVEQLGRITTPDALGGWLATTARRECLRTLRRRGRESFASDDSLFDVPDAGAVSAEAALIEHERDAALWAALHRLPPRCQALLRVLMADPAPSYDDVSVALDMPIGSIGPTRGRCLTKLREIAVAAGITGGFGGSSLSGGAP